MKPSPQFALSLGILVPLLLLSAIFFNIPYAIETRSINRRTGIETRTVSFYKLYTRVISQDGYFDLSKWGTVTAEDREIVCHSLIYRFPWSYHQRNITAELTKEPNHYFYILIQIFLPKHIDAYRNDQAKLKDVIGKRVAIWNSDEIERDPIGVIQRLDEDNKRLDRESK